MAGDIFYQFGEYIDRKIPGVVRAEAHRRLAARQAPPATFRLWQERDDPPIKVDEVESGEEVTQGLQIGAIRGESVITESDEEDESEPVETVFVLIGKMADLWGKMGRYQQKLINICEEVKDWKGRLAQAARTRGQARASTSQDPPRKEPEAERRKEVMEVEDDNEEDGQDERLRQEKDQRAERRTKKRGAQEEAEPVLRDAASKKKKYAIRLEEGFDVEKVIDRLLEDHNDLVTLKEILATFIKNFAAKTGHLRKLVRQNEEWVWGEEQEKVMAGMKEEFKEGGLVLGAPDYEAAEVRPFIVETDAGLTALGGVLIQGYEQKSELVLKPFEEEDPWGSKNVQWMTKLALAGTCSLVDEVRTIEEGPDQVERHEELMGGMYLLTNVLLQGNFDQVGSPTPAEGEGIVPESQDDELEEEEIKEAFRAKEYDGIYLELRLLLSCERKDRDASERAQKLRHLYLVRNGHIIVKRQVGSPRRVVCGRNRQIDIIVALHDNIAGGHRGVNATYTKISELYYWDGMMQMVAKFCRSYVPCQKRSPQRLGEPLHPRLEREVSTVVHLDLLFMLIGDQGYNYIFDARDNLSGFVDGRAIRTKTGPTLGIRTKPLPGEVIEIWKDTPPQKPVMKTVLEVGPKAVREGEEGPQQEEIPSPAPRGSPSPGMMVEIEREETGWRRETLSIVDTHLATFAEAHPDLEEPEQEEQMHEDPSQEPPPREGEI
ncbi:hypothetical protein CBR_g36550 [Chara braunii]|uniref:Integrase zinc-binding domain-containing protein n=1 Tax=Chara braunii TaxID=69332 RepID=A0A388JZ61_CHABU|nr:hypothetical protein CBR_g36550 [Chara braunii]|eukprot:GBG63066.1 hypothetical protein CBR_g36550 [Chara braunii]